MSGWGETAHFYVCPSITGKRNQPCWRCDKPYDDPIHLKPAVVVVQS